eukprot:m.273272 g.273272  ORF g.273272 m.273272 type:complete len:599 (-) comp105981_c0_seq1:146-1942(-)
MAANYVLAGQADCREYAEIEILADLMCRQLPNFEVKKILKASEDWAGWLDTECKARSWDYSGSLLVYRMLGEGNPSAALLNNAPTLKIAHRFVGDGNAFKEMAENYYGITQTSSSEEIDDVVKANIETLQTQSPYSPPQQKQTTICIHEATKACAYQLLWMIAAGDVFGTDTLVNFRLVDGEEQQTALAGVQMEMEDLALSAVGTVECFSDVAIASASADVVVMFSGSLVHTATVDHDQSAVSEAAVSLIKATAGALSATTKVLMIGDNCNSAASALVHCAQTIPPSNVTTLMRIPQTRANACIAEKFNTRVDHDDLKLGGHHIKNVIVWGGDGCDPVVDVTHAVVSQHGAINGGSTQVKLTTTLREPSFVSDGEAQRTLEGVLKPDMLWGWVRERDSAMAKLKGLSLETGAPLLVAKAAADQLTSWLTTSKHAQVNHNDNDNDANPFDIVGLQTSVSQYGVPAGLFFSFPARWCDNGPSVVAGLTIAEATATAIHDAVELAVRNQEIWHRACDINPVAEALTTSDGVTTTKTEDTPQDTATDTVNTPQDQDDTAAQTVTLDQSEVVEPVVAVVAEPTTTPPEETEASTTNDTPPTQE